MPQAHQQHISKDQNQQQAFKPIRLRHLSVPQSPAVAAILLIAKHLLDGHPLAVPNPLPPCDS
jgi:hypothetical protein